MQRLYSPIRRLLPLLLAAILAFGCDDPLDDSDTTTTDADSQADVSTTDTLTIAQVLDYYSQGCSDTTITARGYIVGTIGGTKITAAQFSSTTTVETNILLADDSTQTDTDYLLPVQLVADTELRDSLNLATNPDRYHRLVAVTGTLTTYFLQAGLKEPTAYHLYTTSTSSDTQQILPSDQSADSTTEDTDSTTENTDSITDSSDSTANDSTSFLIPYSGSTVIPVLQGRGTHL